MRPTAAAFIAASLDGYIARADDALDWLPMHTGEDHGYDAFMRDVDALVMGRRTFEVVRGLGAWPYGARRVVVQTRRSLDVLPALAARVDASALDPAPLLARLGAEGVRRVYVDGGVTITRFLAAGCLDELVLTRIPVLLGSGVPLFGALAHDVALDHVSTRAFPSGLVQSHYRVRRAAEQA